MQNLVAIVKAHALENYETGKGWDSIVECWTDEEIEAELRDHRVASPKAAIRHMGQFARVFHEQMLNTREG